MISFVPKSTKRTSVLSIPQERQAESEQIGKLVAGYVQ